LIAGITVGAVVVPQGMSYAKLADLPPEFGLYSSFVGVLIYWFFATSKDITIGPVAVMSTLVGNIVSKYSTDLMKEQVASAIALICGCIVFFLGVTRLGFIVDFIPLTATAAFMTGSALNIAVGQVPGLMGITGFDTRAATYLVFINTLKHLGRSTLDAAIGLTSLLMLYLLRWFFTSFLAKKYPRHQRTWFFLGTLRTAFVILLYTMISWLVNMHHRKNPLFKILGKVPRGFKHMGAPRLDGELISAFSSELPATVIVMLIEHIAISKSFGRVNNYTINPSQELIAIGITNIIGPFFGAYPATGSFSRTAIKSKAGVRTPLAGLITAVVVLLAIYALTAVFFYIPNAALAAVIIHAVGDLITPPNTSYKFWRVSPLDFTVFIVGVIVTVFTTIEIGIYVTVAVSGAILLFRIAKARGHFLGKVRVHSVIGDHLINRSPAESELDIPATKSSRDYGSLGRSLESDSARNVFLPIDHRDGSNPSIDVSTPYPGIFVYRFSEGFLYANAAHYTEKMVDYIFAHTRRTDTGMFTQPGDRPWNDPGPKDPQKDAEIQRGKPTLKAIILDFSSVNNVDVTSVQNLIDVRNQLDRYAAPDKVEWHFAAIENRWTKRALSSAGFGWQNPDPGSSAGGRANEFRPVFSVAEVGDIGSREAFEEGEMRKKEALEDPEAAKGLTTTADNVETVRGTSAERRRRKVVAVASVGRPFFHVDLEGAVRSAVTSITGG